MIVVVAAGSVAGSFAVAASLAGRFASLGSIAQALRAIAVAPVLFVALLMAWGLVPDSFDDVHDDGARTAVRLAPGCNDAPFGRVESASYRSPTHLTVAYRCSWFPGLITTRGELACAEGRWRGPGAIGGDSVGGLC